MYDWTNDELLAFADEHLAADRASQLEHELRTNAQLVTRISTLLAERNSGALTLGDIWRSARASCHPPEAWAALAAGTIHGALRDMLEFHRDVFGCRECRAAFDVAAAQPNIGTDDVLRSRVLATTMGHLRREATQSREENQ